MLIVFGDQYSNTITFISYTEDISAHAFPIFHIILRDKQAYIILSKTYLSYTRE